LGKKWLDRAKDKNIKLFIENERLGKENGDLKDRLQELEARIKDLEEMLAITKKHAFRKEKKE
jgi:hypothetical protein